ncbi:MAG: hypothetical protein IT244_10535 [Bacteroidia bacterium]|nr:hypothetical protein [Bacteroidia bacterium]
MKKVIFTIVFVLSIGFASAQTQHVMRLVNGVAYNCTGVNGMEFNSDGSVTFLGGLVMTQMTAEEIKDHGNYNPTGLGDIKVNCSASTTVVATPGGGGVLMDIYGQKCGPATYANVGASIKVGCMNSNGYLCSAKVGDPGSTWTYFNADCN